MNEPHHGTEHHTTRRSSTLLVLIALASLLVVALGGTLIHNITTAERINELRREAEKRAGYVDAVAIRMEKKATELALNGEAFYKLKQAHPNHDNSPIIADFLTRSIDSFPEASGGGIWYEPYRIEKNRKLYGPYAYWKDQKVEFTWDLSSESYDYTQWSWYRQALPEEWPRNKTRPQEYYWSPPYQDEAGTSSLVVTVTAFIHNHSNGGEIIGISCIDWTLDHMLSLIQHDKLSKGSHSFLLDTHSGTILTFSLMPGMQMHNRTELPWLASLPSSRGSEPEITLQGIDYTLFTATTHNGILYGMLVPESEISGDLERLIVAIGIATLLLVGLSLTIYKVAVDRLHELITKRTAELSLAKEAAEASARAKSRFLANMSHEIRTPLNGVVGFTNLLAKTTLNATQKEYLQTVQGSLDSLLTIINDILDFSRIESGKLLIHHQRFDLSALLSDIAKLFAASAQNKGLELTFDLQLATPYVVKGDPVRIRQLLGNLLSNAIKFTDEGAIVLRVSRDQGSLDEAILFDVIDSGRGIDASTGAALFDAFEQVHSDDTRTGTGLGLAICKSLTEAMGGSIGFISLPRGTRFWVRLPLPCYEAVGRSASAFEHPGQERLAGSHILVVDDVAINRKLITTLLDQWHVNYREANNGAEAIALYRDEPFDLILMDIRMPVMDGMMATRTIRQHEESGHHIPIIGLTAHAFPHELEEFVKAGMDDSLTKPIHEERLLEILMKYLDQR